METLASTSEIVEFTEELHAKSRKDCEVGKHRMAKLGNKYYIEEDINRLFESIDIRTSARGLGRTGGRDTGKSAMKRPIRIGGSHASGIGISEAVSLKQALRGLCISQASEMAAMKRLSKPAASPSVSEAGSLRRLYTAVVAEASGSAFPNNEVKQNLVEISLVPEGIASCSADKRPEMMQICEAELYSQGAPPSTDIGNETAWIAVQDKKSPESSCTAHTHENAQAESISASTSVDGQVNTSRLGKVSKGHLDSASLPSCAGRGTSLSNSTSYSPRLIKPVFRSRSFVKKKMKQDTTAASSASSSRLRNVSDDLCPCTSYSDGQTYSVKNGTEQDFESPSPSNGTNNSREVNSSTASTASSKPTFSLNCSNSTKFLVTKADNKSTSREKGEFSQSSKSSIGEYSSSTSFSESSSLSGSGRSGSRPHMSKDLRWEAIHCVQKQQGSLSLKQFKLLRKLGCGDIGSVYLAELSGTNCLYALKVMDNEFLASRKKMSRAQTEREIMELLDHPFLPTLYAYFSTNKLSCLIMEYCPGGDLHVLRQKQPGKSFYEQAARFYVAEVLLALEYLHMLGVIYRDLKPENVLVREDGHIMLTDFDLSLRCTVNATLLKLSSPAVAPMKSMSSSCSQSSCIEPFCLNPSFQVPCFTPGLLSVAARSRRTKADLAAQVSPLPQLVVEPTNARSNSFVGTHEYLAPEIIKGEGHGSAVDWWTFGIFMFELLYGRTPFKGSGNDETLANVVSQSLKFPSSPPVSFHARDLIRGLLIKDPQRRLGSAKGATEIKQHPFFDGLNWALIRCMVPPDQPKCYASETLTSTALSQTKEVVNSNASNGMEEHLDFEMF